MEAYEELVAANILGKKTGAGFYKYNKKGKREGLNPAAEKIISKYVNKDATTPKPEEAALRAGTRFALEAAFCLQDEVIRNPVDGDMGAVFGVGFPPFKGGPFRWIDTIGAQNFVDRLDRYRDTMGEQWEAPQQLRDLLKSRGHSHDACRALWA